MEQRSTNVRMGSTAGMQYLVFGIVVLWFAVGRSLHTTPLLLSGAIALIVGLVSPFLPWDRIGHVGFHVQSVGALALLAVFGRWLADTVLFGAAYVMVGVFVGVIFGRRILAVYSVGALLSVLPLLAVWSPMDVFSTSIACTSVFVVAGLMQALQREWSDADLRAEQARATQSITAQMEAQREFADAMADGIASLRTEMVTIRSSAAATAEVSGSLAASNHQLTTVAQEVADIASQTATTAADANSAVASLSERTRAISASAETIKGIANRTNLLALNASIEAARAGEVGRGFAIVADEVRSLASHAATSADEIEQSISSVVSAVDASEGSVGRIATDASTLQRQQAEMTATIQGYDDAVSSIAALAADDAESVNTISAALDRLDQRASTSRVPI
ncbi:MAG: methyl-accepting chemotaxis protein [Actinomycetota bacterium]